ncbi:MAG: hypothetical protein U9P90_02545 [Patescibacteria group bacterium]|nr:hypothetical protein [Patescibacteria group bacterium]
MLKRYVVFVIYGSAREGHAKGGWNDLLRKGKPFSFDTVEEAKKAAYSAIKRMALYLGAGEYHVIDLQTGNFADSGIVGDDPRCCS